MPGAEQGGQVTIGSPQTAHPGPVLIAGAGLAGLTAAFELSRLGIDVRIVDERPAPPVSPQTLIVHARTLALLERRGLGHAMLGGGNLVDDAAVYSNGKLIGTVPLAQTPGQRHEFLLVSQPDAERTLRELLAGQGVAVEHATELIALAGDEPVPAGRAADRDVQAILRHHDGRIEEMLARYLISADGAHGAVRRALGRPAARQPAGHGCVLADLQLDGDLPGHEISVLLGRRGFLAVFPLGGRLFRCVGTDPRPAAADRAAPAIEELQQLFDTTSPVPVRLRDLIWTSRLPASRPDAPVLRRGRIFFGGESAHAYRPASSQGVNYGIQDMINLSWKLAMVLHAEAVPELLDTYRVERLGVIRDVARRAEAAADVLGKPSALAHQLVTRIAPVFLDARFVLRLGADLVGEVITDYQDGPLAASCAGPGGLQSGDSLPDLRVLACDADAPPDALPSEVGLHDLADSSRLTLLFADAAGALPPPDWQEQLAPWRQSVRAHRIAPAGDLPDEHSRFTGMFGGRGVIVTRPDLYVGFAGPQHAIQHLVSWLGRWFPATRASIPASGHAA
jgi:2-polyprenyl-6-methoxyphenol hydroxylase-like FAD-dependent oxidoreductase